MSAIVTQGLQHRFGKVQALAGVDLEVPRGAVYGFIGPNGAGKTTCLRILAGLLPPSEGSAQVAGCDVVRDRHRLYRVVGYMPDFFGVYDDLRVHEYLHFYAAAHGRRGPEARRFQEELLELVNLADKRDAFVNDLSRGMKQRLCLARALIHDPEVLLLDEPASGLDPAARIEFRELLKELAAMGKTIVVSSHILSELADVSTHVGILYGGRLLASGPIRQVLARVRRHSARIRVVLDADGNAASGTTGGEAAGGEDLRRLVNLLLAMPEVSHVERPDPGEPELIFDFQGGEAELAEINRRLVAAGYRVSHLADLGGSLEEAFLDVVRGNGAAVPEGEVEADAGGSRP